MLNVDKNYCDSSYIDMYWKNNIIIDQSKTRINENRNLSLEDDIKKENLYFFIKNIENKQNKNIYKDNRVHNYNKSNVIIPNTIYNNQQKTIYNNHQNTYKNNNYYNKKNKEYTLPKKSRCKEYNLVERKILLDSFSKPKLLYEPNIKN
jgi:hypothetical protein